MPNTLSDDTSGIASAVAVASAAEVVVLVLGVDLHTAREGVDAASTDLSYAQARLLEEAAAAAASPVVVVLMGGTPLDIRGVLANQKVGAVLLAGMPSVNCGGIADVLFGAVPAAGRAVQTWYPASFAQGLSE